MIFSHFVHFPLSSTLQLLSSTVFVFTFASLVSLALCLRIVLQFYFLEILIELYYNKLPSTLFCHRSPSSYTRSQILLLLLSLLLCTQRNMNECTNMMQWCTALVSVAGEKKETSKKKTQTKTLAETRRIFIHIYKYLCVSSDCNVDCFPSLCLLRPRAACAMQTANVIFLWFKAAESDSFDAFFVAHQTICWIRVGLEPFESNQRKPLVLGTKFDICIFHNHRMETRQKQTRLHYEINHTFDVLRLRPHRHTTPSTYNISITCLWHYKYANLIEAHVFVRPSPTKWTRERERRRMEKVVNLKLWRS